MTTSEHTPQRGEVWKVQFDPVKGSEIGKTRPAVVVGSPAVGRLPLRIIVPLTGWKSTWAASPWLVHIEPTKRNGLKKESAADAFQIKSVSLERFTDKVGVVDADIIEEIAAAVAVCVGL